MEGKIFVYGFCIVAVIAGSIFWRYTMELDDVQAELTGARTQLNGVQGEITKAKAWLTARKEAAALIQAKDVLEKGNAELRSQVSATRQRRADLVKQFQFLLNRVRSETVGMVLPEATMTNGSKLKNAKVQFLDKDSIILAHDQGISKLPISDLPEELVDRVRNAYNPDALGGSSNSFYQKEALQAAPSLDTSASDKLVKMGLNAPKEEKKEEKKPTAAPSTVQPAAAAGTRTSLGRTFTPGQGFSRQGLGGSAVNSSTPREDSSSSDRTRSSRSSRSSGSRGNN